MTNFIEELDEAVIKRLRWAVNMKERVEQGLTISDEETAAYDNLDRAIKNMEETMKDVGVWPD